MTDRGCGTGGNQRLDAVLAARYLDFSLPYRTRFASRVPTDVVSRLIDAIVELVARLHLVGFFGGDCSLSNTLFRRDAAALAARLVDTETAGQHPALTEGQRAHDLDLAEEWLAGERLDLVAARTLQAELDPAAVVGEVRRRQGRLRDALTGEEVLDADDAYCIPERIRRLAVGYDVSALELVRTGGGTRLRMRTQVLEPGHHRWAQHMQTGRDVQENQARRLLNDLDAHRARLQQQTGARVSQAVAASRWLADVPEPTLATVPAHLRHTLEPAELCHRVLDHRWFLSEALGAAVGTAAPVRSSVEVVLPYIPDERHLLAAAGAGGEPLAPMPGGPAKRLLRRSAAGSPPRSAEGQRRAPPRRACQAA